MALKPLLSGFSVPGKLKNKQTGFAFALAFGPACRALARANQALYYLIQGNKVRQSLTARVCEAFDKHCLIKYSLYTMYGNGREKMLIKYKTIGELAKAMKTGEIPEDVVSPGAAAVALGVTRGAIHSRLRWGTLDAWSAESVVLVSAKSLRKAVKVKRNIPETQGELHGV